MISARDLSVGFGGAPAVREARFSLAPGARVGLVGESGSGKSMLGLALMGMAPEAARVTGSLTVDGVEMAGAAEADWARLRARRMALVFQEPMTALDPLQRIGEAVAEPIRLHLGLDRAAARARAEALLAEAGLPEPAARARQFPHELSGGQRQRALLALALACDPALLIADEPTTALDAEAAVRVTELLARLAEERGMALLFISHDLAAVARATTELLVIYGGDIVERGPTAAVLAGPRHPYTQGLLAARPRVAPGRASGERRPRLPAMRGSVPPLARLPAGCRFAGRCPVEMADCATHRPPEILGVRCWRAGAP